MKTITMPSFGSDMAKGEVAQWYVKAGDAVKNGDIIASIETMKGLIDMEVFDDGVIEKLLVEEGTELLVGQAIAELRLNGENTLNLANESNTKETLQAIDTPALTTSPPAKAQSKKQANASNLNETDIPRISPAARQKAEALGIDWRLLRNGQGPQGAIVLADIEGLAIKEDKPSSDEAMRQAIGAVVSRSKREIPHYYLQLDIVVDKALEWLNIHNQSLPSEQRILLNAVLYSAIARALLKFPEFNGFYANGLYKAAPSVHLGNVINLRQGGLVVAAIHNAQDLACKEMMSALKDQVIRAREGRLRMSEMQDATVTVSNLGDRGCDSIQSIIFTPQVAIIGIGRQRTVPWIVKQKIDIANIVTFTLAADHRVSDGHSGARLLNKINKLLQEPEGLI